MPKSKDLKRLTRSRMQKTGESYTTARAQLLAKKERADADPASEPRQPAGPAGIIGDAGEGTAAVQAVKPQDLASLAGISDEAVAAATGRTWSEWVQALDARDAASLPHREIAAYVGEAYDVSGWWAQMVTVGYERIKGRREVGQQRDGSFEANKSKTFPVPLARLYGAFADAATRERWLPGVSFAVRKATSERSMRITWEDGTAVDLWFTAKGEAKSQVQVQHRKLPSREAVEESKAYWAGRLGALGALLAGA